MVCPDFKKRKDQNEDKNIELFCSKHLLPRFIKIVLEKRNKTV